MRLCTSSTLLTFCNTTPSRYSTKSYNGSCKVPKCNNLWRNWNTPCGRRCPTNLPPGNSSRLQRCTRFSRCSTSHGNCSCRCPSSLQRPCSTLCDRTNPTSLLSALALALALDSPWDSELLVDMDSISLSQCSTWSCSCSGRCW